MVVVTKVTTGGVHLETRLVKAACSAGAAVANETWDKEEVEGRSFFVEPRTRPGRAASPVSKTDKLLQNPVLSQPERPLDYPLYGTEGFNQSRGLSDMQVV